MALKLGKSKEDIKKLAEDRQELLMQGDVTKRYAELMMNITPDSLNVDNNNKEVINNMVEEGKDKIVEIKISDLSESPKNCYNKPVAEKREEMISSLKSYGQITPIFVRPRECIQEYKNLISTPFEILVGHSRVDCLKEIGKETVNAIIVNCDDVEATLLIAQSNIQREKVSALEQARAYKNTYEALKQTKGGNYKMPKSENENVEIPTVPPKSQSGTLVENGLRTDELVAKKYGISKNTLHRKMALAYCTSKIVNLFNDKKINQEQIQSIAKLDNDSQDEFAERISKKEIKITNDIAKKAVELFKKEGKIDFSNLGKAEIKNVQKGKVNNIERRKYSVSSELFPPGIDGKERREDFIIKALSYIKLNNIEL